MNKDLTEIVIVLDESGSMGRVRNDTIEGLNSFIDDQKKAEGKALLTVVTFSYSARTVVDAKDIQEVELFSESSYRPSGGTALLDAIGTAIDRIENRYTDEEDESKIPAKVMFAIVTDGEENSSKAFNKSQIARMIKHQTNRHGWEFVFLGANLDAVSEARSIGIGASNSFNFAASETGTRDMMGVLSRSTVSYRATGDAMYSQNIVGTSLEEINIGKQSSDAIINIQGDIDAKSITDAVAKAVKKSSSVR